MSLAAHHEQLRDAVRRYARERLAPNAPRWDREKHFPREEVAGLAAMGLCGIAIPEEQGGVGMDYTALALACEEIAVTDKAAGKKGISAFVVPTSTPGYRAARIEDKTGQRASDTAQAVLAYAGERKSMGKTLIEHQAVNFRLADMATGVEASRQLYLHAAQLRDAGAPCLKEASMAKLFASETAEKVCSDAIQIHGGYGYVTDFPVERIWRDVRVCQIYEGASDIQRLVIGRALVTQQCR